MKDPVPYLKDLEVDLECAVNERLRAQIDEEHQSRVNYELYYFASDKERNRFNQDPRKHCGIVTDPVSKQRFRPGTDAPMRRFAGQPWFFVSDSTETLFAAMPDSFLAPAYSMKPKAPDTAGTPSGKSNGTSSAATG